MKVKIFKSIWLLLAVFTVFAVLLYTCKKDEPEPTPTPTPEPVQLIISNNVVTIDSSTCTLISDSTELIQGIYHYQYTGTPPNYTTSSVIVGQQGYGYMRKVTNVTANGNDIVLQTEQARLTDVIDQCDIQDAIKLNISKNKAYFNGKPVNMRVVYLAKGVSIKQTKDGKGSINLTGTELFSGNVGGANLTAEITNGSISFEPNFNRELKISLISPHIRKIKISATGSLDFDCDLQLVCSTPVTYDKKIPIAAFEFGPIMLGPVPMFVGLSFYAGFETELNLTGNVKAGSDANASVEFGAQYYESQWSTIWNKSADFDQHPITWGYDGNAFARAYVSPQISVKIAAVAGPYLEVEPYLEFNGDIQSKQTDWQWELDGGLDGNLGFLVGIFGYNLVDYNTTLLNWETTIASNNSSNPNPPVANFTANTTSIAEGGTVNFTDLSANVPTSWSWNFGDGGTSTSQDPSHTYSTAGTYTVSLTATNSYGSDTQTKTNYITVSAAFPCGTSVTFVYRGNSVTYGTVEHNGKCWLDRNLGASQVATAYNDANAYGDLFQWGRLDDGHQDRTSGTTSINSSTDNPGHSNFITDPNSPSDWRVPQNDNLWQGVAGTNNPCPTGWRIPTDTELDTERLSWGANNSNGAYASPLKLVVAGYRYGSDGSLHAAGSCGYYWSSTVDGSGARRLYGICSSGADMGGSSRATGFSVRCIKD